MNVAKASLKSSQKAQWGEPPSNCILCREVLVPDSLPGVSNAHDQISEEDAIQDEYMAAGLRGLPIQRTSSCSSFGSEGAPSAANGSGMNGYHRGYQGTCCLLVKDLTNKLLRFITQGPPSLSSL